MGSLPKMHNDMNTMRTNTEIKLDFFIGGTIYLFATYTEVMHKHDPLNFKCKNC